MLGTLGSRATTLSHVVLSAFSKASGTVSRFSSLILGGVRQVGLLSTGLRSVLSGSLGFVSTKLAGVSKGLSMVTGLGRSLLVALRAVAMVTPFGWVAAGITGATLLYQHFDKVKALFGRLMTGVSSIWETLKQGAPILKKGLELAFSPILSVMKGLGWAWDKITGTETPPSEPSRPRDYRSQDVVTQRYGYPLSQPDKPSTSMPDIHVNPSAPVIRQGDKTVSIQVSVNTPPISLVVQGGDEERVRAIFREEFERYERNIADTVSLSLGDNYG
ncbi:hypothetical protein JCM19239_5285 [Vibrio variabilis]|uniref:Phage tail length tape-measure protein n=1 Tax=Vibrio variabilis TaxID=990271 RepID=A0ABQ0JDG1_9VIBR|nr:hypothetical protein JCM19239_5285 [Vibrio variabilis]